MNNQIANPASAIAAENGVSPRAWPKIRPPAAILAISDNLSASSTRCSLFQTSILFVGIQSNAMAGFDKFPRFPESCAATSQNLQAKSPRAVA